MISIQIYFERIRKSQTRASLVSTLSAVKSCLRWKIAKLPEYFIMSAAYFIKIHISPLMHKDFRAVTIKPVLFAHKEQRQTFLMLINTDTDIQDMDKNV